MPKKLTLREKFFTEDLKQEVLDALACGETLLSVQKKKKLPMLRKWVVRERIENETFRHAYWEAQRSQQEFYNDQVVELASKRINGSSHAQTDADINQRRIEIDSLKWVSGRMAATQGCKNFKGNFKKKTKAVGEALTTGLVDIRTATSYLEYVDKEADIKEKTEIADIVLGNSLTKKEENR